MRHAVDAGSKSIVLASAIAALWLETKMGWPVWAPLPLWTIGAALVAGVLARFWPVVVWSVLLAVVPLLPVGYLAALDAFPPAFHAPWFAAVLAAAMCSRGHRLTSWSFDEAWRTPLVCWALVVAVGWPIAAWREMDFTPSFSSTGGFGANALSGLGGQPAEVLGWISTMVLAQLVGLIFFDWASGEMRRLTRDEFRARVVLPSAAGALVAAAFACYQGVIDVHFLNAHQWPALGRAGGGLLDGDAAGPLMGIWVSGFLALTLMGRARWRWFGLAGAVLSWGGLWATGSRMALLSGLIALAGLGLVVLRAQSRRVWWALLGTLAAVAIVTVVVAKNRADHNDPLIRAVADLPEPTVAALTHFARTQLFDRTGPYGTVSVRMMERYPVGGVGLGSFETLFPDFAYERDHFRYWRDNAQSWFRSQLAELGVVGSAGWIAWLVILVAWLWRSSAPAESRSELFLVKTALVAVAAVSLAAMPTRSVLVGFSVWVFIAWGVSAADGQLKAVAGAAALRRMNAPAVLLLAMAIPVVTAADLWRTGHGSLRPVSRAAATAWEYQYGLYGVETRNAGETYRWTAPRAVAVVGLVRKSFLKISIQGGPPDLPTRPFGYRLLVRGQLLAEITPTDDHPRVWYIDTKPTETHVQIEIQTTRGWRGTEFGYTDPRELGVIVEPWSLVDHPPPGATLIK